MIFDWNIFLCSSQAAGHSTSPLLVSLMMSWGLWPSTSQPTDWTVPGSLSCLQRALWLYRSVLHPSSSVDNLIKPLLPRCLMSFSFSLSLAGSWRTLTVGQGQKAPLLLGLSVLSDQFHVLLRPFQALVAFGRHHQTFLEKDPAV